MDKNKKYSVKQKEQKMSSRIVDNLDFSYKEGIIEDSMIPISYLNVFAFYEFEKIGKLKCHYIHEKHWFKDMFQFIVYMVGEKNVIPPWYDYIYEFKFDEETESNIRYFIMRLKEQWMFNEQFELNTNLMDEILNCSDEEIHEKMHQFNNELNENRSLKHYYDRMSLFDRRPTPSETIIYGHYKKMGVEDKLKQQLNHILREKGFLR